MGRVINTNDLYNKIQKSNFGVLNVPIQQAFREVISECPTANTIKIPKGATNGDMIKSMFPNEDFRIGNSTTNRNVVYKGDYTFCKLDWWNAPYKGEQIMTIKEAIEILSDFDVQEDGKPSITLTVVRQIK